MSDDPAPLRVCLVHGFLGCGAEAEEAAPAEGDAPDCEPCPTEEEPATVSVSQCTSRNTRVHARHGDGDAWGCAGDGAGAATALAEPPASWPFAQAPVVSEHKDIGRNDPLLVRIGQEVQEMSRRIAALPATDWGQTPRV